MLVRGEIVDMGMWVGDMTPTQFVTAAFVWTGSVGAVSYLTYNAHLTCLEAIKNASALTDAGSLQDNSCYWMLESHVGQVAMIALGISFYALGIAHIASLVPEPAHPVPLLDLLETIGH